MTKSEIIESITYVGIPPGATLVEHANPLYGFTLTRFDHTNTGGMKIIAARMFADQLKDDTADLPEVPDANLLCRLHRATLDFHKAQVDDCFYEAVRATIVSDHRKMVAKIREIASKLKVTYQEPEDPLLK